MEKFEELKDLMDKKFNEINSKLLEIHNKINLLEVKFQIILKGKNESEENIKKEKMVNIGWDQERIERIYREINFII